MEAIFPGVKVAGRNPDHRLTSSAKVRISGDTTPLPRMPSLFTLFFPVFYQADFIAVSQTNLALHIINYSLKILSFDVTRSGLLTARINK